MLASCAIEVKLHDWETCDCLGSVTAPDPKSKAFLDISWCNEGKHLAAVPLSGKSLVISTYQTSSINTEEKWKPPKDIIEIAGVRCLSFSKVDNPNIIVGTVSGEVLLYNIIHKRILNAFAELPSSVNYIQFGVQDSFIAAGCANGQIYLYSSGDAVSSTFFVPCSESVTALTIHPRVPNLLAGGSEKGVVAIWDINAGTNTLKSTNHTGTVLDMSFSIVDDTFTTIGNDKKINIYDLRTSECVHEKQFDGDLTALAYCPNGTDIAVATGRGQIICLDKRYLHSCKTGLKAHKCAIKKILFDTVNMPAKQSFSKSTEELDLFEEEVQPSLTSNSEIKSPGGGDFNISRNKVRFGCNFYQTVDKYSTGTSKCQMGSLSNADRTTFHIIDEHSLNQLRAEIMKANREIVNGLIETMNNEFLKMRMGVSREFCTMEIRNKKRWQDFNMILLKIGDLDEQESEENKENSLLTQVKTKLSSSQCLNRPSTKSVK